MNCTLIIDSEDEPPANIAYLHGEFIEKKQLIQHGVNTQKVENTVPILSLVPSRDSIASDVDIELSPRGMIIYKYVYIFHNCSNSNGLPRILILINIFTAIHKLLPYIYIYIYGSNIYIYILNNFIIFIIFLNIEYLHFICNYIYNRF